MFNLLWPLRILDANIKHTEHTWTYYYSVKYKFGVQLPQFDHPSVHSQTINWATISIATAVPSKLSHLQLYDQAHINKSSEMLGSIPVKAKAHVRKSQ